MSMPANLLHRRKQEIQASEDSLLDVMIAVLVVGMVIALALTAVADAGLLSQ
jgi:hypothetical protein